MIYCIIDGIFMLLPLILFTYLLSASGSTWNVVAIYYSLCTYSLYQKFEKESQQGLNGQYDLRTITTAPN